MGDVTHDLNQLEAAEGNAINGLIASQKMLDAWEKMVSGRKEPVRYLITVTPIGSVDMAKELVPQYLTNRGAFAATIIFTGTGDKWSAIKERIPKGTTADFTDMMLRIAEEVNADLNKPEEA
jgi:hypothetical protein